MLSGNQKRPEAKAKTDRSRKRKGPLDNYFYHWVYALNAIPRWRWQQVGTQRSHVTPDSHSGRLRTGSDTSRFESVDSDQGRNKVRLRSGQEASLVPSCSNLRSLVSKCTVLKKVLVTLLGLFGAPIVIRRQGNCALLVLTYYAAGCVQG